MKKTCFIKTLLLASIFAFAFIACSDDDENDGRADGKPELDKTGAFVLNEGRIGFDNATLSYYSIAKNELTSEILEKQNDKTKLGDLAQDILIYDSKVFITVNVSNMIFVTDLDGVILKEISTKDTEYKDPRHIASHGGYIYIDFYSGHLVKLDPATYEVVGVLEIPAYSEQMTVAGSELFITNSLWTGITEGKTITVVNLTNFEIERAPITVHDNPSRITSDKQGNIYILSDGVWDPETYTSISALSVIEAGKYQAEVIRENIASKMAIQGDRLLLFNTVYGERQTTIFSQYDLTTGEYSEESFLTTPSDAQAAGLLDLAYYLSVDPKNNDIYVSTTDYATTGSVLVFDKDGKYKTKFSSGGINPQKVAFMAK